MPGSVYLSIYLCVLAGLGLQAGQPPPAAELLKLDGKKFYEAAEEARYYIYPGHSPYSVEELIAIAEKLAPGVEPVGVSHEPGEARNPFSTYFSAACEKAEDAQLDRLIELYVRLNPSSFDKAYVLSSLAVRVIGREVVAIREEHGHASLAESAPPLPAKLRSAPTELKEAWRMFQRASATHEKMFPHVIGGARIEAYANLKSFYRMIDAALMGKGKGLENELQKYADTGPNCLDITDIEDGKDIATLLILLRERRLDEAVGAALRITRLTGADSPTNTTNSIVVELFKACGLDWETIFAGAVADQEIQEWSTMNKPAILKALGLHGSAKAGLLVNQLAHLAKPEDRTAYAELFNSWIETSPTAGKCRGKAVDLGSRAYKRLGKDVVPAEMQAMFLHATEEFTASGCSEYLAQFAVNTFGRTQSRTSIPSLQALTRHHVVNVAEAAALVLCAMGLEGQVRPVTSSVRFRISVNGKPLPEGSEVQWGVYSDTYGVSSSVETKSDGVIELERTHFNDPNKPATLVRLSRTAERVDETQFRVDLPPPANLDQLTEVSVQAGRLRLDLRNLEHLNAPATKMSLKVVLHEPEEQRRIFPSYNKGFEMPVGSSIILPNIQHGTYDLSITLPGAKRWQGIAAVGPEAPPTEVELKPGSDLHYEIVMPDGTHQFGASLFKDGEEVNGDPDFQTHTYRGLACGNYVLRISGSQPMEKDPVGRSIQRGPDEISFAGREVAFTIKPGSPALIDLGEIQLRALPDKPKAAQGK